MIKWIEEAIFPPGYTPLTALIIYQLEYDVMMRSGRLHDKKDSDFVFNSQSGWPGQRGCRDEERYVGMEERVRGNKEKEE